ncbi:hypothetical protein HS1genome_0057 [Sulfodiicoccus acidiphilus]|uniref:Uncharacterized protein n=1 Tax=Sulfodiicoccus acidiphilus TaxID=1670455 RepID=A0A348B0G6_9CREN|nr:hypothetical protein [Sulfodiicoccus acidiphilus]BBD71668.1 hypothetical protein HS1genome_0057 [Sulfodiicoccus acidiphilus]GGT86732.1 hypothetical protein GCM10007116_00890 [Sulfodiicoccus acidiphilus]
MISRTGPNGITVDKLIELMIPLETRESVLKSLEELVFGGYVDVLGESGSVRVVASKSVRTSMVALELHKLIIVKKLQSLRSSVESKQENEAKKCIKELSEALGNAFLSLSGETPELTIPELLELIRPIRDRLGSVMGSEQTLPLDLLKELIGLVSKYKGDTEAKILENILQKEQHVRDA